MTSPQDFRVLADAAWQLLQPRSLVARPAPPVPELFETTTREHLVAMRVLVYPQLTGRSWCSAFAALLRTAESCQVCDRAHLREALSDFRRGRHTVVLSSKLAVLGILVDLAVPLPANVSSDAFIAVLRAELQFPCEAAVPGITTLVQETHE